MLALAYAAAYLTIVVGLLGERVPIKVILALVKRPPTFNASMLLVRRQT